MTANDPNGPNQEHAGAAHAHVDRRTDAPGDTHTIQDADADRDLARDQERRTENRLADERGTVVDQRTPAPGPDEARPRSMPTNWDDHDTGADFGPADDVPQRQPLRDHHVERRPAGRNAD